MNQELEEFKEWSSNYLLVAMFICVDLGIILGLAIAGAI